AQAVADGDRIGVAGQRDQVVLAEDAPLVDDSAPDFREHDAVRRGIEALVAAGVLHGLERDAAHAGPALRISEHVADLAVIDAFADDADQRGRDARALQRLERPLANAAEIGAPDR